MLFDVQTVTSVKRTYYLTIKNFMTLRPPTAKKAKGDFWWINNRQFRKKKK